MKVFKLTGLAFFIIFSVVLIGYALATPLVTVLQERDRTCVGSESAGRQADQSCPTATFAPPTATPRPTAGFGSLRQASQRPGMYGEVVGKPKSYLSRDVGGFVVLDVEIEGSNLMFCITDKNVQDSFMQLHEKNQAGTATDGTFYFRPSSETAGEVVVQPGTATKRLNLCNVEVYTYIDSPKVGAPRHTLTYNKVFVITKITFKQ